MFNIVEREFFVSLIQNEKDKLTISEKQGLIERNENFMMSGDCQKNLPTTLEFYRCIILLSRLSQNAIPFPVQNKTFQRLQKIRISVLKAIILDKFSPTDWFPTNRNRFHFPNLVSILSFNQKI